MPLFLLDTNAAIAVLSGNKKLRNQIQTEDVFLSSVVLGELYFGAENSGRRVENLEKVDEISRACIVLTCDQQTARVYSQVRIQLKRIGKPISPNDNWIAATAMQHDLILLTRDTDFNAVDGLTAQSW